MAWRMSWRSYGFGDDDLVIVYWFPEEPDWRTGYVGRMLGTRGLSHQRVYPRATPHEIADWTGAATVYVDEVAAAAAELRHADERTWRRRRGLVGKRRAVAAYERARTSYLDRVRAATSAYRPVRDVIDQLLADQRAAREATAKRESEAQERRNQQARAQFQAWEQRQTLADTPLPSGLTPRELAARGENPADWPSELAAAVGDVAAWWSGVRASVRNERARADAVREVVDGINATAAALEAAGRLGIRAVKDRPPDRRDGWWVSFSWSGLPDPALLRTPPDMPIRHLGPGDWHYGLPLPDRELLSPSPSGEYQIARVRSESFSHSFGSGTRYWWWGEDIETFAEDLFPGWISYLEKHYPYNSARTRITDHADPTVYIPFVRAVARCAVAAFHALLVDVGR